MLTNTRIPRSETRLKTPMASKTISSLLCSSERWRDDITFAKNKVRPEIPQFAKGFDENYFAYACK